MAQLPKHSAEHKAADWRCEGSCYRPKHEHLFDIRASYIRWIKLMHRSHRLSSTWFNSVQSPHKCDLLANQRKIILRPRCTTNVPQSAEMHFNTKVNKRVWIWILVKYTLIIVMISVIGENSWSWARLTRQWGGQCSMWPLKWAAWRLWRHGVGGTLTLTDECVVLFRCVGVVIS